jgi:hypothetical protein
MDDWMHATNRDGIASVAGLRGAGLGRRTVIAMVKAGVLTPLAFGWYASGPVLDDGERHVLTTRAMLRAYGGRVVAGHHSALLLLGLRTLKADLGVVRQSRRTTGPTRVKRSVRIGRAVPATFQSTETVIPAVQQVHGDPYSQGIADLLRHADGRHESPGETWLHTR